MKEVSVVAEVREPGGLGYKVITVVGILFFLVVVAVLIRSYDSDDSDVAAVGPAVTTPAPIGSVETATQAPVGAVATGGGGMAGMAGEGAGVALPVFVGLVALTMLAAGGIALRRREA